MQAADFAKQESSIQEIAEIKQELELNQALAEGTKLLCLILTIPSTSASYERASSSLKHVKNYEVFPKWRAIKLFGFHFHE